MTTSSYNKTTAKNAFAKAGQGYCNFNKNKVAAVVGA